MARGDCERAFEAAARDDGILLVPQPRVEWLTWRGHLAFPPRAQRARDALHAIFLELGGDLAAQGQKRSRLLVSDFLHEETGTLIEVDEDQHFTSCRLLTLQMYPADVPLGFDLSAYQDLCSTWAPTADRYRRTKRVTGFGEHGRQRQRAYNDALRDLGAPAMGLPPVVRAAAPDRDGGAAYARIRERLACALTRAASLPTEKAGRTPGWPHLESE